MELNQLSKRIYFSPYEQRLDRPNLGYIYGERCSVIVDAGASTAHANDFYCAVSDAGLPTPEYTAITHWHWDHTFGMCAAKGRIIAHKNTRRKLIEMQESSDIFSYGDERMRLEYPDDKDIVIVMPDIIFKSNLELDLGDIRCHILKIPSPHSDDSTAIWIPEEKLLFLGDATSPDYFNNGIYDDDELSKMTDWLNACDFETCLLGHSEPLSKAELMEYLRSLK